MKAMHIVTFCSVIFLFTRISIAQSYGNLQNQNTEVARPGWKCPNGNSFDECTHECKYVRMINGKPDFTTELECGDEIAAHSEVLKKIWDLYEEIFNTCGDGNDVIQDRTPCNFFAIKVLQRIFYIDDFLYYNAASSINSYLHSSSLVYSTFSKHWTKVSATEAIIAANQGYPAIASSQKHVAIVIPGGYVPYSKWEDKIVPKVVAMSKDNGQPYKCMPCEAYNTFGSDEPSYFVKK